MKALSNPWLHIPGYDCFGCAPHNPIGLKMKFFLDNDDIVSIFPLENHHQGWIDTLHGGIQASLLDEICAWKLIHLLGTSGVTAKMEIRYKKPVLTTCKYIIIRANVVEQKRNIVTLHATITSPDGVLCSEAECIYFSFDPTKAKETGFSPCEPYGEELTLDQAVNSVL